MKSWAAKKKPPVPQAGSQTAVSGPGCITSTIALISGRGVNNGLGATAISLTTSISPGTLFATDGLNGGLYPPGLPVAKVAKVTLTPGAATYNLTLIPTADLRHLAYVDVVLWEPST